MNAGYAIVSIDYRLAPETKLPQIIEDLRDAYTWLHDQGPRLFNVDTGRIAVVGDSAGGYLTLMSGISVKPRPAVLAAFWGYGDITADWYTKPTACSIASDPSSQRTRLGNPWARRPLPMEPRTPSRGGGFTSTAGSKVSGQTMSPGFDPKTQDSVLTPYCPARNVTKDYPPTILVHGTDDTDVPYTQSVQMEKELPAPASSIV